MGYTVSIVILLPLSTFMVKHATYRTLTRHSRNTHLRYLQVKSLFTAKSGSGGRDGRIPGSLIPAPWLFGPVWTFLYVTIAISGWLVWREAPGKGRGRALAAFIIQLALNGLWSYLFFGLKNPGLAFADIMALWLGIVIVSLD